QTRILVSERRHDDVVDALAEMMAGLQVGDPADDDTDIGPLVARRQQDRVQGYIKTGVDEGARIVLGGADKPRDRGWYVQPTLFADASSAPKACPNTSNCSRRSARTSCQSCSESARQFERNLCGAAQFVALVEDAHLEVDQVSRRIAGGVDALGDHQATRHHRITRVDRAEPLTVASAHTAF